MPLRPTPLKRSNRRIYDVYPFHDTGDDLILMGFLHNGVCDIYFSAGVIKIFGHI